MQLSAILSSKGSDVTTIAPDSTVAQLVGLLVGHGIGAVVVSRDGRTINGIVSERDVIRAMHQGHAMLHEPVSSIMTAQVHCAPPHAHVDEMMHLMTEQRVRHIPVIDDDGQLLGIVSIGDIVKTRLTELEGEREALVEYITGGR
jgi:CBS domain-containing protein